MSQEQFSKKTQKVREYIDENDVQDLMEGIAIEHFRDSFQNEDFTDESILVKRK